MSYSWPDHWQAPGNAIRCIASNCDFATHGGSDLARLLELQDHCIQQAGDQFVDHFILLQMLRQKQCVYDGCGYDAARHDGVKDLFSHEKWSHGNRTTMSRIESFIVLVRQGRVDMLDQDDLKKAIFARMETRIHWTGNSRMMIFRRAGYMHPAYHTPENLRLILSPDRSRPYWEPVPIEYFLMNIAPGPEVPQADLWREIWTRFRNMYAGGRI